MFKNKKMEKAMGRINTNTGMILDSIVNLMVDLGRQNDKLGELSSDAIQRADYYDNLAFEAECKIQDNKKIIKNIFHTLCEEENINE